VGALSRGRMRARLLSLRAQASGDGLLSFQILEELNEVLGEGEVPRTGEDIRSLKYLHHVINETLRCVGARPNSPEMQGR